MSLPIASNAATDALAPTGTLRAGINLSNNLLVTDRDDAGNPVGVSPDMARSLSRQLGVGLELIGYPNPGALTDAATTGAWDIGNVGAAPGRTDVISFTSAYCEIDCTYLVPAGSRLRSIEDVDRPGVRIASTARTAYDLWLGEHLRHAELVRAEGHPAAWEAFVGEGLDALAGLRSRHVKDAERLAGSRVLEGRFTAVQQAIGTPHGRDSAGVDYLETFVQAAIADGLVAELIDRHGVQGLLSVPS